MRNLNNYEIAGRTLRVDNACTEKSRMEMQNLLQQPTVENPYGEPIQSEKAPEAISKAVASLPPEQMFELMQQMKLCIQNNPAEAKTMLLTNPQLAYALLQAQVVMRIIDPATACVSLQPAIFPNRISHSLTFEFQSMLHKNGTPPPILQASDKPATGAVPINTPNAVPTPVAPPAPVSRSAEFQSVLQPPHQNQNPVFSGLFLIKVKFWFGLIIFEFVAMDVDLRGPAVDPPRGAVDPRSIDPRLARMGDQDMRMPPVNAPAMGNNFSSVET